MKNPLSFLSTDVLDRLVAILVIILVITAIGISAVKQFSKKPSKNIAVCSTLDLQNTFSILTPQNIDGTIMYVPNILAFSISEKNKLCNWSPKTGWSLLAYPENK